MAEPPHSLLFLTLLLFEKGSCLLAQLRRNLSPREAIFRCHHPWLRRFSLDQTAFFEFETTSAGTAIVTPDLRGFGVCAIGYSFRHATPSKRLSKIVSADSRPGDHKRGRVTSVMKLHPRLIPPRPKPIRSQKLLPQLRRPQVLAHMLQLLSSACSVPQSPPCSSSPVPPHAVRLAPSRSSPATPVPQPTSSPPQSPEPPKALLQQRRQESQHLTLLLTMRLIVP